MASIFILAQSGTGVLLMVAMVIVGLAVAVALAMVVLFLSVWARTMIAATPVSIVTLLMMRLDGVDIGKVVDAYIKATRADLDIPVKWIEQHQRNGGNVGLTVDSMVAAKQEGMVMSWQFATSMDLSGRDAVQHLRLADAA
ncbi:MAG: flotillin-like FloA family protein [Planctomycetota bacterium]